MSNNSLALKIATAAGTIIAAGAPMASSVFANTDTASSETNKSAESWQANSAATVGNTLSQQKIESIDQLSNYQVQWGDTLSVIAQHFNTSSDELAKRFGLTDPNLIITGVKMQDQKAFIDANGLRVSRAFATTSKDNPTGQSAAGISEAKQTVESPASTFAAQPATQEAAKQAENIVPAQDVQTSHSSDKAQTPVEPAPSTNVTTSDDNKSTNNTDVVPAQPSTNDQAKQDDSAKQPEQPSQPSTNDGQIKQDDSKQTDQPAQPSTNDQAKQDDSKQPEQPSQPSTNDGGKATDQTHSSDVDPNNPSTYKNVLTAFGSNPVGYVLTTEAEYDSTIQNAKPGDSAPTIYIHQGNGGFTAMPATKGADGNWYEPTGYRVDPYTRSVINIIGPSKEEQDKKNAEAEQAAKDAAGQGGTVVNDNDSNQDPSKLPADDLIHNGMGL